ncbi:aspartate carbamoyltransferase catalytic subunit [Arcanobacterium pluranimalium]|uniref:aspartate carbamoyltransferase n=1 Tax=Arcanobacterium pluranimalium TaxID=108028 RepID=UPI001958B255|nr:aspartate carbamoyltransferase [Arcanobacterium pluranimalium]MBM7824245.1 aspartate carbamoyltransferase catalytic subunit [Arcanobacterium pluranimalium]
MAAEKNTLTAAGNPAGDAAGKLTARSAAKVARSLIDILDLNVAEIEQLIARAVDIADNPEKYSRACAGKKLATLFYEPSTRTRLSFEAAMYELGGRVLGFSEASSSSVAKGESVADTARVISCYADIVAMRHPFEGAPLVAALNASVPVINAGDGGHNHPTQTLTDLLTIYREKGRLSGLTIGFCGDLKYGRTVHSLVRALARHEGIKMVFISPAELRMPDYIGADVLGKCGVEVMETESLDEALPYLDVLYMTRIQQERFKDQNEYMRLKDSYILRREKLVKAKLDMCILHPLPRVNEIAVDVDDDPRACYFEQVLNGKYIRMALINELLNGRWAQAGVEPVADMESTSNMHIEQAPEKCGNTQCISAAEPSITPLVRPVAEKSQYRCFYCESLVETAKN